MRPTATEPTARLSSGRIVTEGEVRAVLERAGLSYPLPPALDTDAECLTMADHLAIHPEDAAPDHDGEEAPR